jgi:prepilin-type N-terminal cleavage/methylation domain-containing protein/prepilin-type processing-associated H-X9-DG protein
MKTRAFTLNELLTVIAILAVLAALILASLSSAKGQATATACRNNLDQIAKAMAVYTADFSEYPGTRASPIYPPRNLDAQWEQIWDHRLLPYVLGNRTVFSCPADMTPPGWPPYPPTNSFLTNYTYGYNAYGTGVQSSTLNLGLGRAQPPESDFSLPILEVTESQVRAPSDMIAVGDLNDLADVLGTTIWPISFPPYAGGPAARHNGGANMVFCDDHTEFAKQKNWVEETDTARRRWNNDHEPHPETW